MNRCILGVTLIFAAYYDNRENRIPNLLCGISMGGGLAYITCFRGINMGISHCLWAAGLGLCVFPLWCGRILGGGDVKLLMTAGLLLGEDNISFLMCAGVCLGIHACVILLSRKNYFERMTLFFQYVMNCVEERKLLPYPFDREQDWQEGGIRISSGFLAGHLLAMIMGMYH